MAHLLIVDDTEVIRQQLGAYWIAAGYDVHYAADGAEGLAVATQHPDLQLVITDYNMPAMDGLTMLQRIRALPGLGALPCFMLTTESSPALKALGKGHGVKAWIIKPCAPDKVLAAVHKILAS